MIPSLYFYCITPVPSELAMTLSDLTLSSARGRSVYLSPLQAPVPLENVMLRTREEAATFSLAEPVGLELWGWVRERIPGGHLPCLPKSDFILWWSPLVPPLRVRVPRPSAAACLGYSRVLREIPSRLS